AASALFSACHVLGDAKYQDAAIKIIEFLWRQMYQPGHGMFHYRDSPDSPVRMLPGYLADQVCTIAALADAFEGTGDKHFLARAEELAKIMDRHLWDDEGGYWDFPSDPDAPAALKIRMKPFADNGYAAIVLTRLHYLTGERLHLMRAEETL